MASLKSEDDQARFASVVLPHLADAYALARWLTGDRADAEDVVQEACLRAFRGIGGFAGVNARAWVLTIVRHAAYTWLGKNRSASLVMVDDLEAVEQKRSSAGAAFEQAPPTP
jgi:RNA polymerase sigma factor (sigma-70 family)